MIEQAVADYQSLLDAYASQEAALQQATCDWDALTGLMEHSASCIARIQSYDVTAWNDEEAQTLHKLVEHCAAAHKRIGAALLQRRAAMSEDVNQQQRVSKALRAYQGQQHAVPLYQDKHL